MNDQTVHEIMSGARSGIAADVLRAGLRAASVPYAAAMRLRRWAYRKDILPSRSAGAERPVISVGNITTGGTGKTPMVAWVVARLGEMGRRPAILTRGYKSVAGESDEAELLRRICSPAPAPTGETGADERSGAIQQPWVVPVVVDPDRLAGAREALEQGADVLVMDDGFQHLRLRRDLDIVLIDATNPFGYGRCLPRGLLREPAAALRDADAVVITRIDALSTEELAELASRLSRLAKKATIHSAVHRPVAVIDENGRPRPLDVLSGRKVAAFCGIGNPQQFFAVLGRLSARIVARRAFDDHVRYTSEELRLLGRECFGSDAEVLITTQKDCIKLPGVQLDRPVWQLAVDMRLVAGEEELTAAIRTVTR